METDTDSVEDGVLAYRGSSPGVLLSPSPSEDELALEWTLADNDRDLVATMRGPQNICRFAAQLCVFRKHGRFLADYSKIPEPVVGYLCQQLEIKPMTSLAGPIRRNTESEHHQKIADHLGWTFFDQDAKERLASWVDCQIAEYLYVEDLVGKAEAFLRQRKTVIPGPTVMERAINAATRRAEDAIWERITSQIPNEIRSRMDALLDESGTFLKFAEYPPEARAKHIVRFLERYQTLADLGLESVRFEGVSSKLLQKVAAAVKTYKVSSIKRFDSNKRHALAFCFLYESKQTLLDYLAEMHAQFMTDMERKARLAWEKEHRKLRKRLKRGVATLRALAKQFLSWRESTDTGEFLEAVDEEIVRTAIDDCEAFEDLEKYGQLRNLHARYSNFRRYFPHFVQLNFACDSGGEAVLKAIEILRQLESGELKKLPDKVDTSFIKEAWRKGLPNKTKGNVIDRTSWEIGLAVALRDALRPGRIYLPESRNYISFWNLCYDDPAWEETRATAYVDLGLPEESTKAINRLVREFHTAVDGFTDGLKDNAFITITDGKLVVKRDPATLEPEASEQFRQLLRRHLPKIRIEHLLDQVDAISGFSCHLQSINHVDRKGDAHHRALKAALVAHGTNLGIFGMAASTEGITVNQLQDVSRHCLTQESIHKANAELVNLLRSIGHSKFFGEGRRSSSDGKRFGVDASSLLASYYPRYFGYYDKVVTLYTHQSDQFSVFGTQVISCMEREALYVLDGLLSHDADLNICEHTTDTHGYTEQLFALCYLLGFSFIPHIKNYKKQQLYKPDDRSYGAADVLFAETVDLNLIKKEWDSLVRVAASLKNRIVQPHVVARRLLSLGATHPLSKALTHLGRLVKTTYLFRYMQDQELRRVVRQMLNRGEGRHQLADHIFFANQGRFRSGDYFEMMNKASCLSLLSNAVLIWNTLHMGRILDQAEAEGHTFLPDELAHVHPLMFHHLTVNGTYDFTGHVVSDPVFHT